MFIDHRTAAWSDPDVVRTSIGLAVVLSVLLVMVVAPYDQAVRVYLSSVGIASEGWTQLSRFGKSDWLLIPSGVMVIGLFALKRFRPDRFQPFEMLFLAVLFLFVAVAVTGLVAVALKYSLGVSRPSVGGVRIIRPFAFNSRFAAFPSGHSATAAALAMTVTWLRPRLSLLIWPLALAIAGSRVVLAAHFLSDALAGFALGAWGTLFIAERFARNGWLFERAPSGLPLPIAGRSDQAGRRRLREGLELVLRAFADRLSGRPRAAGQGSLAE